MPVAPSRPVLRPGLRLTRRCDGLLQAGLRPPHRIGLPDSPLARLLAGSLQQWEKNPPEGTADLLDRLTDVLVDGRELRGLLRANPGRQGAVAAAVLQHGDSGIDKWHRRTQITVQVSGPPRWSELAEALLGENGLKAVPLEEPADLQLFLHVGEPDSGRADSAVREGIPHLWAGTSAGEVTVGPFVDPGRTPCRRCVIASLSGVDPGHAVVREQYVGRVGEVPEPVDPSLLTMAIGIAVREVVTWADDAEPATWGATMVLPAVGVPREQRYRRQPECGCSWSGAWLAGCC